MKGQDITYSLLFGLLTDGVSELYLGTQAHLADILDVDRAKITNIIKHGNLLQEGKRDDSGRKIDANDVCETILADLKQPLDESYMRCWHDALETSGAMTPDLEDAYQGYRANPGKEAAERFLLRIFEEADRSRTACKSRKMKKNAPYQRVASDVEVSTPCTSFAPFDVAAHSSVPPQHFIGRADLMKQLEACLAKNGIAVLCGIGGYGKTEAALHYAALHDAQEDAQDVEGTAYAHIQQAKYDKDASDLAAMVNAIPFSGLLESEMNATSFGEDAAMLGASQAGGTSAERRMERRMQALASFGPNALLLVDNLDVEDAYDPALRTFLDRLRRMKLHVLITSRNQDLFDDAAIMIPIEPLSIDEQLRLFEVHYYKELEARLPTDKIPAVDEILHVVESHTLTIELAASTMRRQSLTPEELLKHLKAAHDRALGRVSYGKDGSRHKETIDNCLQELFTLDKLSEDEIQLLGWLTLAPQGLRQRLLTHELGLLDNLDLITDLVDRSWILQERKERAEDDRIRLHPLISRAVQENLGWHLDDAKGYLGRVVDTLKKYANSLSKEDKDNLCAILMKAGERFLDEYQESTLDLLRRQARSLMRRKKYVGAATQWERVVALDLKNPEMEERVVVHDIFQLGISYQELYQTEKAFACYKEAETRMRDSRMEEASLECDLYNNLGKACCDRKDMKTGEWYLRKACHLCENAPSIGKDACLWAYFNLGTLCREQQRTEEAIRWHEKAVACVQGWGMGKAWRIRAFMLLGADYGLIVHEKQPTYSYETAMQWIDRAMALLEDSAGIKPMLVAESFQLRGMVEFCGGHYEDAVADFQRWVDILTNLYGSQNFVTKLSAWYLWCMTGVACIRRKNYGEAENAFRRAMESADAKGMEKSLAIATAGLKEAEKQIKNEQNI